jgi:hypothetical protein
MSMQLWINVTLRFYLQYFLFVSKWVQYIVYWQIYYIEQKNETIKFALKLVVPYFASMYGVFLFSTYNIFRGDIPVHKLD